jgi:hypothetical protein
MDISQEFLGAVIGAALGSLVAGYWNLRVQRDQQAHSLKLQQAQWDREDSVREAEKRDERAKLQRAIWDELLLIVPRYVHAAAWIYNRKLDMWDEYKKQGSAADTTDESDAAKETTVQFRSLRERILILYEQTENEKVQESLRIISIIAKDLVDTHPIQWRESKSFYRGRDPILIVDSRLTQLKSLLGRLLRGEPTDDIVILNAEQEDAAMAHAE